MNSASWWVWVVWDQWLLIWFYHASRSTWKWCFVLHRIWIVLIIRCYPDINNYWYNIGWCTDVEETPVSNLWLSLAGGPYWRHPCPTSAESLCEALRIHEFSNRPEIGDQKKSVTNLPKKLTAQPREIWTILLMEEILHQLIGNLSHYLQGFILPRWCMSSSINSTTKTSPKKNGWMMVWNIYLQISIGFWMVREASPGGVCYRQAKGRHEVPSQHLVTLAANFWENMAWVKHIPRETTEKPIEKPGFSQKKKVHFLAFLFF